MKKGIAVVAVLLFVLMVISGCGVEKPDEQGEMTKISCMLDWTPNTNHTGLYVALEKGFYQEEGLDVEIFQAGETGPEQLIAAGKIDFGVSYQEAVTYARAAGIPIVSLAAVIQHNTSGFASLKEDNIQRPKDLEGKRYGGWGSPAEYAVIEAIMRKDGGESDKVEFIDIGSADFFSVIGKDVDFTWIFYGWDGIRAELMGTPLDIIMLKDYDPALDYYTPVIATSEETIASRPDVAKKFMAATAKGYEYAMENSEEAAEILLKHAPELDGDLVKKSQAWLSEQYQADAPQWGWQDNEVWKLYAEWMFERELLSEKIEPEKAFTNEFLPER